MRPQPLICVKDVPVSSQWYQQLLGCRSAHGGNEYDRLVDGERLIMQLHHWEEDHHHGAIGNPLDQPYGNGVLLWFEVDDFVAVERRAKEMNVQFKMAKHINPNAMHWEMWIYDPDGYVVVVASPDGTAVKE